MRPALPLSADITERLSGTPLSILLDIDGTLAPIAPRPDQARVPDDVSAVIADLSSSPGTHVAVVTGRSVEDARRMVPIPHVGIIGNHGFEVLGEEGELISEPAAHSFLDALGDAARRLDGKVAEIPGLFLENKKWTLSMHYRLAPREAIPGLTDFIMKLGVELGLAVTRGKEVLEIRPPLEVNKGTASVIWVRDLGTAPTGSTMYVGDDRTDEDAFRELGAAFPRAVTVRVGRPDAGEKTSAEFLVETPAEVKDLLIAIAAARRGAA